ELAHRHKRYGVGMIYLKLRQEGRLVNYKRVDVGQDSTEKASDSRQTATREDRCRERLFALSDLITSGTPNYINLHRTFHFK
ncbi:hypothetical protein M3O57_19735, partial [Xanthomonas nasturtii]